MGITSENIHLLSDSISLTNPKRILELGNQWLFNGMPGFPPMTPAKGYIQSLGIEHVSVDLNGEDGAIVVDLSKRVEIDIGVFDIVTNFGTLEHLSNVYYGFKFMHDFCRVGGVMVHEFPHTGHWIKHGHFYSTASTFNSLARLHDYTIISMDESFAQGNYIDGKTLRVVFEKSVDKPFISEDEFNYSVEIFKS